MARPRPPRRAVLTASAGPTPDLSPRAELVSGNPARVPASLAGSVSIHRRGKRSADPMQDRNEIAKRWQVEAYRHLKICGEARYAATLFAAKASKAELGVSEPQVQVGKPTWVTSGPEVDALAEVAPTVRDRSRLVYNYMIHYTVGGECYLIARTRQDTDPGYISPPEDPLTGAPYKTWDEVKKAHLETIDILDPEAEPFENPNEPIWEIVAVTELQKNGDDWKVRHDNDVFIDLDPDDPVIRMWNPDPEKRREAWSPFMVMLPILAEVEWATRSIFTQIRSRLINAGVWFTPDNLTFAPPPPDAVEGGEEAIAGMNEAELFMMSLAASSMEMLDSDEVAFPTVVQADPAALEAVSQDKLIKFWSELDETVISVRDTALRRFAVGMDLKSEQVMSPVMMGKSSEGGGGANHWGEWAIQEQTITDHIEPALDQFAGVLTDAVVRQAVDGTTKIVAYDSTKMRIRQDRSKEALEWYDRGVLKADVALREGGFDPTTDKMGAEEHKMWLLAKIVAGQFTPEQMQAALALVGVQLPASALPAPAVSGNEGAAKGRAGKDEPPSLENHPREGVPEGDHEHKDAPYSVEMASCEALVLRALEKAGNRLLNDGKRGRDKDRDTPAHLAHLSASVEVPIGPAQFDFTMASTLLPDLSAGALTRRVNRMTSYCMSLYGDKRPYSRADLIAALEGA